MRTHIIEVVVVEVVLKKATTIIDDEFHPACELFCMSRVIAGAPFAPERNALGVARTPPLSVI